MSVVQPTRRDLNPRLEVLVAEAKQNSPFSGKLYSEMVTDGQIALTELPLVDHSKYSASYHDSERSVMTSCQIDGILMKTGGKIFYLLLISLRRH